MKLLRLLLAGPGLGLLAMGLSGCPKAPEYPVTPEISFNKIERIPFDNVAARGDSIAVTINYQDGDGDLGLTEDESKQAAYAGTQFVNNYFVEPYIKNSAGQFVRLADSGRGIAAGIYNSRFPHVSATTDKRSLPLKGTLTWGFSFVQYSPFRPGEEVRFMVTIADRAKHVSNTITTESVVLSK